MSDESRQVGTIKQYDDQKGYGFLTVPGITQDYFLHVSELRKAKIIGPISKGDRLSFICEQHTNGLRAKELQKVEPNA